MKIFRISAIVTSSNDSNLRIGSKVFIEDIKADYLKETSTGYCLMNYGYDESIVYTVPAGLIAEIVLNNV